MCVRWQRRSWAPRGCARGTLSGAGLWGAGCWPPALTIVGRVRRGDFTTAVLIANPAAAQLQEWRLLATCRQGVHLFELRHVIVVCCIQKSAALILCSPTGQDSALQDKQNLNHNQNQERESGTSLPRWSLLQEGACWPPAGEPEVSCPAGKPHPQLQRLNLRCRRPVLGLLICSRVTSHAGEVHIRRLWIKGILPGVGKENSCCM